MTVFVLGTPGTLSCSVREVRHVERNILVAAVHYHFAVEGIYVKGQRPRPKLDRLQHPESGGRRTVEQKSQTVLG